MRQGRGVPVLAFLVSLVAHAGLLALATRPPPPHPGTVVPIELELIERPAPAGSPPASEPTVPDTPRPAARSPVRRAPGPAREAAPPPARPGADRQTVLPERAPAVPDLAPRWPAGPGDDGADEPAPAPAPTAAGPAAGGDLAGKVRDMLVEEVPFRRAREAADPYWLGVKERLAKAFVVPAEVLEDRIDGGFGPQLREAARAYLAQAKRFGETGNAERPEIYAPHARAIPNIDADLIQLQQSQVRRTEPGEDATRLATWVRVDFARDGSVDRIAVERGSGLPAHDRLALEAVRALPTLGPRPADQGATTIWAFETLLWIVPPLPVAGCAFDAYFVPGPCFYPLKRFVRSTVRLEALP